MDKLGRKAEELKDTLAPMVAMFVAQVSPKKDEISTTKAYEMYGRKWIDTQLSKGNLSVRMVGNRHVLSVASIECLLAAEKEMPVTLL